MKIIIYFNLFDLLKIKVAESTPEKVRFKSNLFGGFGAGLFTPPNTINFGEIFANLGQKLLDNLAVVATITVTALLFIPFALICGRFDKRDKRKVHHGNYVLLSMKSQFAFLFVRYTNTAINEC